MARFTISPKAQRDLTDIWKFIAQDSIQHADRWLERAHEVFALLGLQPRMGFPSDEIHPGTRRFPLGTYIIYYRVSTRAVQILHVFHGKRDQRKAFGPR